MCQVNCDAIKRMQQDIKLLRRGSNKCTKLTNVMSVLSLTVSVISRLQTSKFSMTMTICYDKFLCDKFYLPNPSARVYMQQILYDKLASTLVHLSCIEKNVKVARTDEQIKLVTRKHARL